MGKTRGVPCEKPWLHPTHSPVPTPPWGSASPAPVGTPTLMAPRQKPYSRDAASRLRVRLKTAVSGLVAAVSRVGSPALTYVPLPLNSHKKTSQDTTLLNMAFRASRVLGGS